MVKLEVHGAIDPQMLNRLAESGEILIGYPAGVEHHDTELDNASLARILHYGNSHIPARPFLKLGILSVVTEINAKIKEMHRKKMREGREPSGEFSLEGIGAFVVGAVQQFVRGGYFKGVTPNALSTIRGKKGGDTPLIDEGQLINSMVFVTKRNPKQVALRKIKVDEAAG